MGGAINWVSFEQQVAEKCLESSRRALAQAQAAEFDKTYMGMQIVAHQKMLEINEIFLKYVSADKRPMLEEGIEMATSHLREAKDIMDRIKDQPDSSVAPRR